MTIKGCTVVFSENLKHEDAERVIAAIQLLSGVSRVEPVESLGMNDIIVQMRLETEFADFLIEAAHRWRTRHGQSSAQK